MIAAPGRRSTPARSAAYHRAVRLVSRWAALYTRGLSATVAAGRRDELASDLWEQGAASDARGGSGAATGISILGRAARGVPADLHWRRRQLRPASPRDRAVRLAVRGSLAMTGLVTLATLAVGAAAITRVGVAITRGEFLPSSLTLLSLAVGMTAIACGIALLRHPWSRLLAALWLASGSAITLHFALIALVTLSATVQRLTDPFHPDRLRGDPLLTSVVLVGLTLFYVTVAVAWLPTRRSALPPMTEDVAS